MKFGYDESHFLILLRDVFSLGVKRFLTTLKRWVRNIPKSLESIGVDPKLGQKL